ncbi:TolC family protein [Gangjinia marincola]|uniref:TolC family protein n=1 Tax=Gangjinia marincola TaxID=578463 RepID=A0ABN1MFI3_9FLAO
MIQRMTTSIFLLFSLFIVRGQSLESEYSFTLEEAIDFALENSYQSINARRDVAKAIKQKWETTAMGLPQINGGVDYQNQLKQPVTFIPANAFDPNASGDELIPVVFSPEQSMAATATLSQLIFDGSYLVALQAAKTFLQFSDNALEKTQLEVRKGVINAYGSVLLTNETISIFEKNVKNLQKNLDETIQIFKNGLTEEESVEQLQITLAQIKNQLENTKRLQSIAYQMFNLAIGLDVQNEVTLLDDLTSLALQNTSKQLVEQQLDITNNVDYKIALNLTEQRELELKQQKSFALPSLTGFINYGANAAGNEFNFFSDAEWFESSILGVSLQIPLFSSGMRSAQTARAKIALEQAKTDFDQTQQEIQLALDSARSNYLFAVQNLETVQNNLSLAERIENKNQIKFTEGLSTSFELRQAQTQLYDSQQEVLQAMVDLINYKADLETILSIPQINVSNQN